ncbi:IS1 family transposase [Budviciaceae bacterium CWB-B4]|uniref:IS1 family transposase n=1 Tax=Limnobaculum xujianqingii TaxID=2738837 RepID=A0A9D7AFF5_9GAMM|nr:IS1 family transposase [Limnobaculum xujianqingii]MBK5071755.1 IS1 family transposase [Limnobaculum xujianqingii]MBK5175064.1 IS1 family transposase [Limnobaculum xujianqingii]
MVWDAYKLMTTPECKYCGQKEHIRKHGKGSTGAQRYQCVACDKTFQQKYIYIAYQPEAMEEIIARYQTGESTQQISEHMKANMSTVKRCLGQADLLEKV